MFNIFCFVEDPGATNFLIGLNKNKLNFHIFAKSYAADYLASYGIEYETNLKNIDFDNYDFFLIGTSESNKAVWPEVISKIKKKKIALLIDTPTFVNERVSLLNNVLKKKINYFFLPDVNCISDLTVLGIKKERIFLVNPQKFEYLSNIVKVNESRKIVFFTELSQGINKKNFLKDSDYQLDGFSNQIERTKIVLEEFILAVERIKKDFEFILRIHPKESIGSYTNYLSFFDSFSDKGNNIKILRDCHLAVGLTSNVLAEAASMGLNVLSITPKKKEFNWINSEYRTRIHHVYNKIKLHNFFKDFPEKKKNLQKNTIQSCLLEKTILKLLQSEL